MKKQKAKKAGGAKKTKEEKPEATEPESSTAATEEQAPEEAAPEPVQATSASPGPVDDDDDEPGELPKPTTQSHGRKPSVAVESRMRSASFYRGDTPTSPTASTPVGEVSRDIYRQQAQRIEELERENKKAYVEAKEAEDRWKKLEEELEELREEKGDAALAANKGKEADKLVCTALEADQHAIIRLLEPCVAC